MKGKVELDADGALPVLQGKRCSLRPLRLDDAPSIVEILGDEEALEYWAGELVITTSDARRFIDDVTLAYRERRFFQWALEPAGGQQAAGLCKLYDVKKSHGVGSIGFTLRRVDWRKGLMTDALRALLQFAFEETGLRRLEAFTHPDNARALALLSRLGFRIEGRLREKYVGRNGPQDALVLALLRSESDVRAA